MEKISAVIITFNEANRISRTVESLDGVADEIMVLDSLSTDRTVEIAKSLGCRVESRKFNGFGAQRQYATSLATHRYVLFIDADEVLSPRLRQTIIDLKSRQFEHRIYAMSRLNFYCETPIKRCGWYPDTQIRLFDKRYARWSLNGINESVLFHEALTPFHLDGDILHYRCESAAEYRTTLTTHAAIHADMLVSSGRSIGWLTPHIEALKAFTGTYLIRGGIFEGAPGRHISVEQYRATLLSWRLARQKQKSSAVQTTDTSE